MTAKGKSTKTKTRRRAAPVLPGLPAFRRWWLGLSKSLRLSATLSPAHRESFDYIGLLDAVRQAWPKHAASAMLDLWVAGQKLAVRANKEVGRLLRFAVDVADRMLKEDFPNLAAELSEAAPLLAVDAVLSKSVQSWVHELEVQAAKMQELPSVVPPLALFGHAPERFDAAPGNAPFGLWAESEASSSFPWWNFENIATENDAGQVVQANEEVGTVVASAIDLCWRARLGPGPESWNEFLTDSSREPVWAAWALHRLINSWSIPAVDPRDPAFVDVHLLQVAWGYRDWLRKQFNAPKGRKLGDEVREAMYDLQGFGYVDPRMVARDNRARLHTISTFVVYCCEVLAAAGTAPRTFRKRVHHAWVMAFANYLKAHPNAGLDAVCEAIEINRSTVMKDKIAMGLFHERQQALHKGFKKDDGSIEAVEQVDNDS
ncbi:hypothetical protein PLCT2_00910 [Planctomycetaceae bacterium]|nr:hypothetical protein PLCT2_00910 [Planctomycetaceae bacterium]